jgi:site-specific DNA-methyltransferase (adenine-specific)
MMSTPSRLNCKQELLQWDHQSFDVTPFIKPEGAELKPFYQTDLGALFVGNCLDILPLLKDEVVDTIFADPPFNVGKEYGISTDDRRPDDQYIVWCRAWIIECIRILKPGGALFLYNLPKWNVQLGSFLSEKGLTFRHWIAVELSAGLPIPGRLYPSHYSLLYYTKGKPRVFRRIRTPIQTCRHCGGEVKDYGGHRGAMNPKGVTLKDVWTDIPPVRHWKFKSKNRNANALSTKILDRVVEMSTTPRNLVLDPFGGSGTSFIVCERKNRHWIGIEVETDFAEDCIKRIEGGEIHVHKNTDYAEE